MRRFDNVFQLHQILSNARRPVPMSELEEKLECTRATVNRLLAAFRDRFGAPIKYNRQRNGYFYDTQEETFSLPGFWFSASELHALLTAQQLLANIQPGLLDQQLAPLTARISEVLKNSSAHGRDIAKHVHIAQVANRTAEPKSFQIIASALLTQKRMRVSYHGRTKDEKSEREISPQRLMFYRGNWYLDAFCHVRKDVRSFALERITHAQILEKKSQRVAPTALAKELESTYGIFSGRPKHTAILIFSAERARWIAEEQWHMNQKTRCLKDGRYELRIPYSDPRELILDICKYGAEVEVVGPKALREEVAERLRKAAGMYDEK